MSFLAKKFGSGKKSHKSKKAPQGPSTSEAIQQLRETEDILIKKQEFLENKIQQEIGTAKKNAKVNKRVALQALKRKKRYEQQLQQIDGTLTTIEQQREMLETSHINVAVFRNMDVAAKALKKANNDMDLSKVEDMINEIAEQQEFSREISEAISNSSAMGQEYDDDDLEAELNELVAENEILSIQDEITNNDTLTARLPNVPATNPRRTKMSSGSGDVRELVYWAS